MRDGSGRRMLDLRVLDRLRRGGERTRAAAFVAAWLVALLLVWTVTSALLPTPVERAEALRTTLVIRGPSWSITYEANTDNNTAFGLLREANLTQGFELRWVEYGWPYSDVFITSINGTKNDGARNVWWQYCVNGEYATRGARNQEIRDGDVVRWVFAPPGGDDLCA